MGQSGLRPTRVRPTEPQRWYRERGFASRAANCRYSTAVAGRYPRKTIEACVAHGWAEPWTSNPIKPGWLVCKLTPTGYWVLGVAPGAAGAREQGKY